MKMEAIINITAARYLDADAAAKLGTDEYYRGMADGIMKLFGSIYPEYVDKVNEIIEARRLSPK